MKVAVGLILNSVCEILITRRPFEKQEGGLWEFPGGKLEFGEDGEDALKRELFEEVAITVKDPEFLTKISTGQVELLIYKVSNYEGQAKICEKQLDMRWVKFEELNQYSFPEANYEIIAYLECVAA